MHSSNSSSEIMASTGKLSGNPLRWKFLEMITNRILQVVALPQKGVQKVPEIKVSTINDKQ